MDFFAGDTPAERGFQRRVWESQRAISGAGETNPFEIFRQRGEYIDRTQNAGGLEPWEFGYTEPPELPDTPQGLGSSWVPDWWCNRFPRAGVCRGTQQRERWEGGDREGLGVIQGGGGLFGVEWGSFFLRTIYIVLGIIVLGIGAAALANNAGAIPLGRTLRAAQRFAS